MKTIDRLKSFLKQQAEFRIKISSNLNWKYKGEGFSLLKRRFARGDRLNVNWLFD
jgi:hypothetical protein